MLLRHQPAWITLFLCVTAPLCRAQLTTEQKIYDFRQMVAYYEYSYAPAAWKKQVFGFDLHDTAPWFDRVQRSADDLEYYDICYEYVASLNDSHSQYQMPSDWSASLGFTVDNYDVGQSFGPQPASGTILIESIDRGRLPADQFPFEIGDELLSVEGVNVEDWIRRLSKWASASNPRSKRSMAAQTIVARTQAGGRMQAAFPRAPLETGDSAVVQIRRQNGAVETYTLPWLKSGPPGEPPAEQPQARPRFSIQAPGSILPGFALPADFQRRMGEPRDLFFSGVFPAADLRIGYIRIPAFQAQPESAGIAQFAQEIAYMQANTDGLVLDIMHNPGGSPTYLDALYSYISPEPYQQLQAAWRPTLQLLGETYFYLAQAQATHADPTIVAFYQSKYQQVEVAHAQGADLTPPFPLIGTSLLRDPARDDLGRVVAYSKPIMLLTDDQSVSAADVFAALFQDNQRGIIFGIRTNGGGGKNEDGPSGVYSHGQFGIESNILVRNHVINAPGYPATPYLDTIGVQPDTVADLMTKQNLLNHGDSFSQAMVGAITAYIRQTKN
jgi:hypothetical protein